MKGVISVVLATLSLSAALSLPDDSRPKSSPPRSPHKFFKDGVDFCKRYHPGSAISCCRLRQNPGVGPYKVSSKKHGDFDMDCSDFKRGCFLFSSFLSSAVPLYPSLPVLLQTPGSRQLSWLLKQLSPVPRGDRQRRGIERLTNISINRSPQTGR